MAYIKLGKDRTLTLPEDLCKRLKMEEGDPFLVAVDDGTMTITSLVECWSQERIAGFLLNDSCSREEFDRAVEEVKKMGLDPETIPFADLNDREKLRTDAEWASQIALNRSRA
jgi:hypothetical protein